MSRRSRLAQLEASSSQRERIKHVAQWTAVLATLVALVLTRRR